jgi:hypothetical protein
VILSAPVAATALLFSADGVSWVRQSFQSLQVASNVGGAFSTPGYYLAATTGALPGVRTIVGANSGGGTGTVLIAVFVGSGALILGVLGWLVGGRRLRHGRT